MSLDPSWISTIFGLIILIGEVLSAMCFAVVVERILFNYKPMSEMLKPDFVHDHGKWMLAFTMVWAYFSFSQWLIIWAGNLPAEITFYLKRLNGGWGWIALFLRHLPLRDSVRDSAVAPVQAQYSKTGMARRLADADALRRSVLDHRAEFLAGLSTSPSPTLSCPIAIGGFWLAYFFRNLGALPLLPAYDPSAGEVLHPEHHHPENAHRRH